MNKKNKLEQFGGNVLFALDMLIIFLLVFESRIVIPSWLQPVGRMHPLFLHFPIVILLLAMGLEFFRFTRSYRTQEMYQSFTSGLLLTGAVFSALTVIMGLFLSREEGYEGALLQWHKWTATGIVFLASFIYWSRDYTWYKAPLARTGSIVTCLSLVLAGHYGATLTHGDNFLLLSQDKEQIVSVPIGQAVVFDHVIRPIFESKCISCHNPEKLKGSLLLSDTKGILKGGKTGKLFEAGKPEGSLLLQRIHLPEENKKHMPPSGKAQLTPDEVNLLYLWVKANADFRLKVTELPVSDSLRLLSVARLKPAQDKDHFDFAPASEAVIKKLNNDYRVVVPVAMGSPALSVNLYNRTTYTPAVLKELTEIKDQVVSLDLNKMPVQDAELGIIAQFKNLRHLNLNFTDITGMGLKELASLERLESLSLAGTMLAHSDLQQFSAIKNLAKVSLWNTGLDEKAIQELQDANKSITFIDGFRDDGIPLKLNPPRLKNEAVVFREALPLTLSHAIKGVEIRYTTDGSEPDSIHSTLFREGVILTDSASVKARAYKQGWISSDVVSFDFLKCTYRPDTSYFLVSPHQRHRGNGTVTFFDGQMGDIANRYSTKYVGFKENDMELVLVYKQPVTVSSVVLHELVSNNQQVFAPASIEIWGGMDKDNLKLLGMINPPLPDHATAPAMKGIGCTFNAHTVSCLKIRARPVAKMPAWSAAKGQPALLLVDEILIN